YLDYGVAHCESCATHCLGGLEGRRDLLSNFLHNRQFRGGAVRSSCWPFEDSGVARDCPGGCCRVGAFTSIQFCNHNSRELYGCNVRVSVSTSAPDRRPDCIRDGWFFGWVTRLVRRAVGRATRESILRILDFTVRGRRPCRLRWRSCICPTPSPGVHPANGPLRSLISVPLGTNSVCLPL